MYFGLKGEGPEKVQPLSQQLHQILIEPAEGPGKLRGAKILGIAPNGFLHHLPFAALVNRESQYLMDQYDLFFVNSTSILGAAMDRREKQTGDKVLLAFGNPDGSLKFADLEVDRIAGFFDKKSVYSRGEAKKSTLKKLEDYTILHLSTHGKFDARNSLKSYLVMADGNLTVEEIWGLPLGKTGMTVLSACETGLGEVLSGDDVVSLENAFVFAGSPTVVATLWKVEDRSTSEIMAFFYENLSKGMTKARSLAEAQRKLRKQYPHPFYWAPFTVRGDWR